MTEERAAISSEKSACKGHRVGGCLGGDEEWQSARVAAGEGGMVRI